MAFRVLQLPLYIEAQVLQLRLSHFSLSMGLESVNSPLRFCPGGSLSLTDSPLPLIACLNLRLVTSFMYGGFKTE